MKLRWNLQGLADREAIYNHIEVNSIEAAVKMDALLWKTVRSLLNFPGKGHRGRIPGTLELVVSGTPYIIIYRPERKTLRILQIVHGASRFPDGTRKL